MKLFTTCHYLKRKLKGDFKKDCSNEFEKLKKEIIDKIKKSKRSVEDQKIEAIAKIEEKKNNQMLSTIATSLSFSGLAFSLISLIFQVVDKMPTEQVVKNLENKIDVLRILIIALIIIGVILFVVFGIQKSNYKTISYYTVKLYCIECIEENNKNSKGNKSKK